MEKLSVLKTTKETKVISGRYVIHPCSESLARRV